MKTVLPPSASFPIQDWLAPDVTVILGLLLLLAFLLKSRRFRFARVRSAAGFLRLVQKPEARFERRSLLNKSEQRLFRDLEHLVPRGCRVMAQVSYGEIIRCRDYKKFLSINSKRADMIIVDRAFEVLAVIEYQGAGHYGRTEKSRASAIKRDRWKRQALDESGTPLLEIPAKFDRDLVGSMLAGVLELARSEQDDLDSSHPTHLRAV